MNTEESKYITMQTNIPITVKFKYSDGKLIDKEYNGKKWQELLCGVIMDGKDKYLSIPDKAYPELKEKFGDLKDKIVVVAKIEQGNKKVWTFNTPANVNLQAGVQIATQAAQKVRTEQDRLDQLNSFSQPVNPVEKPVEKYDDETEKTITACLDEVIADHVYMAKTLINLMGYTKFQDIPDGQTAVVNTLLMDIFKKGF